MSLLTIIRNAWARLGADYDVPSAVMTSSDASVVLMRSLATQEGRELARRHAWQRLTIERSITTTATEEQTDAIPADFDRMISETEWNYTQRKPLLGPLPPQEWQGLKASVVGPPDLHYRIRGSALLIVPVPPASEDVRFEYVSKYWVDTDGDGEGEADAWASDTDTALLDEEVITLGVIWRFLKSRRLPFADELAEYNAQVAQVIARDGGRRTLDMRGARPGSVRKPGIPDGSWNVS